jgi:hypothetical protein
MSVKIFLSTVSNEFSVYRDQLRTDFTRHNVEVKVQEDFKDLGGDTLDKLVAQCDAVIHLVAMTGADPGARESRALLAKYPDLTGTLPPLGEALKNGVAVSYTQWEAWLALYHDKLLHTAILDLLAKERARKPVRQPRNLPFASRDTFLDRLHETLAGNQGGHAAAVTGKALHGLGRIGRTRLAVEYALQHESEHSALVFVFGRDAGTAQRRPGGACMAWPSSSARFSI